MEFLQQLQIQAENSGTSTGKEWLSSGGIALDSFSPVDGKRISVITTTDRPSYDKVVETANLAFPIWRAWPAHRIPRNLRSAFYVFHNAGKVDAGIGPVFS